MERSIYLERAKLFAASPLGGTAVYGALCLGLALGRPDGVALPFALALAAASPVGLALTSGLAAMAGYLAVGGMSGIRYAAAVAVMAGVRLIFRDVREVAAVGWFTPALAATVTASTGLALLVGGDGGRWFLLESALAGVACLSFDRARAAWEELRKGGSTAPLGYAALVATVGAAALTAAGWQAALGAAAAGALLLPLARRQSSGPKAPETAQRAGSSGVKRVAQALSELSDGLKLRGDGPLSTEIFSPAVDKLCRECNRNHRCWGSNYNSMMDCLTEMAMLMRRGYDLSECELPQPFAAVCTKKAEFAAAASEEARLFEQTARFHREGLGDVSLLREQYRGFSAVLEELGSRQPESPVADERLSSRLAAAAPEGAALQAVYTSRDKLRLTGYCAGERPDLHRLCSAAAAISGKRLSPPILSRAAGGWDFVINEAESFAVSSGRHISPSPGERIAGDTVRDFVTEDRKLVTVISDGMGAGQSAGRKSRMAADCLEKLMQAGLGRDNALRILNCALLIGAEPEVYATLDVALLDLYTGELEFIKAGAAPSFIVRDGKVTRVESRTLPAGILPLLEPEVYRCRVQAGDRIIMLSDGLLPAGECPPELERHMAQREVSPKSLVTLAKKLRGNLPPDDMTAVVLRVEKN